MAGKKERYDLTVVGGGPGGYAAAIRARQLGMSVALVERARLGGICLNWGCIPTKALLRNADLYRTMQDASEWGISTGPLSFDLKSIVARSRKAAGALNKGIQFLMKKNGVKVASGSGRLEGAGSVVVEDANGKVTRRIETKRVLLATGGAPRSIPGVTLDRKHIVSSTEAMLQEEVPRRLVVLGGGAIGIEFAYFYAALGADVTVLEMLPRVLPQEDEEISKTLTRALSKQGIRIDAGARVQGAEVQDGVVKVRYEQKDKVHQVEADLALVAAGVTGNVKGLGLEPLGGRVEHGFIQVGPTWETGVPGVFAIGDVTGPPLLAHMATAEGIAAVEGMAGHSRPALDPDRTPACTYCQPQVASIGLTETQAEERGIGVKVGRFHFRASGKAVALGETEGLVKLVFDDRYEGLLGVHMVGHDVTELVGEAAVALSHEATARSLLTTVHAHPTLSEAIMEAAADALGEAIHV